jgi:signal transduction histidine kinase
MPSPQQRLAFLRYGVAIVAVILATLLRLWVDPVVGDSVPFPTYFLAIMCAAWYGGLGPSVTALILGGVVADYLFVPPRGTLWFVSHTLYEQMEVGLFFCVGVGIILFSEAIRRTQQQLLFEQQHQREQVEAELAKVKNQLVRQTRLAAIGQVSASIAHDLRNPLSAMGQGVSLLRRYIPNDQPEGITFVELVEREVGLMDRIIRNLTEMAHGKQPKKEKIDLGQVACEVFNRLDHGTIDLQIQLDPQPFVVDADSVQLHQVLGNLLANAVQAMGKKGQVRIQAARCGNVDTIVVEDDGPGIPQELRERVFEPLVTTKPKGTGLGLAICRQILDRHGGSIELLSTNKSGAAFQICLPSPGTG